MESNNTIKYLIGALFLVALIFGYFYFSGGKTASSVKSGVTPVTNARGGSEGDQTFLQALLSLRDIDLSKNILTDLSFVNLKDFSRELVDEPKGRINPFAPFDATLQLSGNFNQTSNTNSAVAPSIKVGD